MVWSISVWGNTKNRVKENTQAWQPAERGLALTCFTYQIHKEVFFFSNIKLSHWKLEIVNEKWAQLRKCHIPACYLAAKHSPRLKTTPAQSRRPSRNVGSTSSEKRVEATFPEIPDCNYGTQNIKRFLISDVILTFWAPKSFSFSLTNSS